MEPAIQHSRIGLVGSGEFTSAMTDIDRQILTSIGPAPTVVVLPTAAAGEDPEDWALRGVERAIQNLGDGWAERRVRRQFHQLLLAIEREALRVDDEPADRTRADREAFRAR